MNDWQKVYWHYRNLGFPSWAATQYANMQVGRGRG